MKARKHEILINAVQLTKDNYGCSYEFILNNDLQVINCIKIHSIETDTISQIRQPHLDLNGLLFELNHVRVDPQINNNYMLNMLTEEFKKIDVKIKNKPHNNSIKICYKPLGEISDNIRFYLNTFGKTVFLSPAMKPKLVI